MQFKNDEGTYWNEQLADRDESTWREQEIGIFDGIGSSWWNLMPTQKCVDEFEPGDPRKYMSIWCPGGARYKDGSLYLKYENYGGTSAHYGCRKYCQDYGTSEWESGINDRLLRYSDILLMYAECIIETGGTDDDAATYIDMVRARANNIVNTEDTIMWYSKAPGLIPSLKALIAKDTTINGVQLNSMTRALRHERFVELFGEYQRYYDLLRWSMGTNDPIDLVSTLNFPIDKGYKKGREFLPYPSLELSNNPLLKLGPGN